MASYSVRVKSSAIKELESLPPKDLARVAMRIEGLATDPRPPGCEKLSGQERYRLRQGDYRILYEVDDPRLVVTIVKVGHRREVYR
ncbi:MAG TPA: type II toxin-antitoxin system mRNA interferase toxin, RelE/StbE family [Clostridiales bacterium]|nr:type II toxin-antitoxin system mRNA interferase toxin, RelE/StbE family [Clostridiales bacterium]